MSEEAREVSVETATQPETSIERAKEAYSAAQEAIAGCFNQDVDIQIHENVFVPMLIFDRISQIHSASILLAENNLPREALILVTSQFELLLDLMFIFVKAGRATIWLEHSTTARSPWAVRSKIDKVFYGHDAQKKTAIKMYEVMCSVKHSNPAAGPLGFNVKRGGDKVVFSQGELNDEPAAIGVFVVPMSTYIMSWGALLVMDSVSHHVSESHHVNVDMKTYDQIKGWLDWAAELVDQALNNPIFGSFKSGKSLAEILDLPK
ncbi:MAG: hypothetical protein BZY87_08080 [SAR202 cluster bacterium Io17-Chloro-G6]|nr:MAG: hypothetical protein BZY87_08080 [SAR202 cluster bacterium Io17-Chloro-G6]